VHGICFDAANQQGFTSNGRANTVTVFNLNDNQPQWEILAGKIPDAIMYEPYLKKVVTCNGGGNNLSIIDPLMKKTIDSVAVGGRPEEAASDGQGKLYVNLEDKNQVAVVDLRTLKAVAHWSLGGGEGPTGLAIDKKTHRLFIGCEKLLVVMDAGNGKIITRIPIGDGCDGVAFDDSTKTIFTSNGEGNMSVIHEENAGTFKLIETVPTKQSARTIALDPATHAVYLPAADLEPLAMGEKGRPKIKAGSFQVLVFNKK
jgi:DNA-binding beta-propeller fold protein YncE